jgi:hypothetical protein
MYDEHGHDCGASEKIQLQIPFSHIADRLSESAIRGPKFSLPCSRSLNHSKYIRALGFCDPEKEELYRAVSRCAGEILKIAPPLWVVPAWN